MTATGFAAVKGEKSIACVNGLPFSTGTREVLRLTLIKRDKVRSWAGTPSITCVSRNPLICDKSALRSLIAVKSTMTAGRVAATRAARDLEDAQFQRLMGGPANMEALAAFADRRPADFTNLPPGW